MEVFRLKIFTYKIRDAIYTFEAEITTRQAWIDYFQSILAGLCNLDPGDNFDVYFPDEGDVRTVLCTWYDKELEVGFHYAFDLYKVDLSVYDNPKFYFNV